MISILAPDRRAATAMAGVLILIVGASAISAQAQVRLKARYTISMTGVSIGQIAWLVDIGDKHYTTSANGNASGVLSVLVNGEGSVATRGIVADDHLTPSHFTSNITDDEGKSELRMTFENGVVTELVGQQPPPTADRVPISEADRRGVTDPLSAMLIPGVAGGDALAHANCDHELAIFDGRRRYNLALSFKRIDKVKLDRGDSWPILVCGVILKPIAGYRTDSMLVKYVAGRRNMELWLGAVAGTSVIAPIRVLMPTLIGTLEIQATQFEAAPAPVRPVTPPPGDGPK
jgi:hypothetical protein